MKHYNPEDLGQSASQQDVSTLFAQVAKAIKTGANGTIRHLAPETPCHRAGDFVYNEVPPTAMDPRSVSRIGRIGEDGKPVFFASAYVKGYSDKPVVKEGADGVALRAAALALNIT